MKYDSELHHYKITGIFHLPIEKYGEDDFKRKRCLNQNCINFNFYYHLVNLMKWPGCNFWEWVLTEDGRGYLNDKKDLIQSRFCCWQCEKLWKFKK